MSSEMSEISISILTKIASSLFEMLDVFSNKTQQIKVWNCVPDSPKEDKIGPIDTVLDFNLPEYKVKLDMKKTEDKGSIIEKM